MFGLVYGQKGVLFWKGLEEEKGEEVVVRIVGKLFVFWGEVWLIV